MYFQISLSLLELQGIRDLLLFVREIVEKPLSRLLRLLFFNNKAWKRYSYWGVFGTISAVFALFRFCKRSITDVWEMPLPLTYKGGIWYCNTDDNRGFHFRSSHPEMFLGKGVRKISIKFTGEHPCRSVILIKLLCNFIEITIRHGCSPVNLLHIFRTLFLKNTSGRLPLLFPISTIQPKY